VSVNTLVDQIIGVHTSYERFMKKFGMMRMARTTFRRLLEISPEDRVAQAARQHMKASKDFELVQNSRHSLKLSDHSTTT
jgi:hypothetical protein